MSALRADTPVEAVISKYGLTEPRNDGDEFYFAAKIHLGDALYAAGIKGSYDALSVHFYDLPLYALRVTRDVQRRQIGIEFAAVAPGSRNIQCRSRLAGVQVKAHQ